PLDFRVAHAARADHQVEALIEPGEDLLDLFNRRFIVGVDEADDPPADDANAIADAAALATTLGRAQDDDSIVAAGKLTSPLARAVVAVGRHDHLEGLILCVEIVAHGRQR